jgi:hypothetical protein
VVRIREGAEQHFLSFSKKEPVLRKKMREKKAPQEEKKDVV